MLISIGIVETNDLYVIVFSRQEKGKFFRKEEECVLKARRRVWAIGKEKGMGCREGEECGL